MDNSKMMLAQSQMANKTTVWLLFLFLGWSYGSLGKIGLQILFYLTLGGFGLWTLIRLFTLNDSIRTYNLHVADRCGLSHEEKSMLNLFK